VQVTDVRVVAGRGHVIQVTDCRARPGSGWEIQRLEDEKVWGVHAVESGGRAGTYGLVLGGQAPPEVGDRVIWLRPDADRLDVVEEHTDLRKLCEEQQGRIVRLEKALVILSVQLKFAPEAAAAVIREGLHCWMQPCQDAEGKLFLRPENEPAKPKEG